MTELMAVIIRLGPLWVALIFFAFQLTGCASISPGQALLQSAKDRVDERMTYVYCKGWDCPANCAAYAKAYQKEALKSGIAGHVMGCKLQSGGEHAFFMSDNGDVMDNRKPWVGTLSDVGCELGSLVFRN